MTIEELDRDIAAVERHLGRLRESRRRLIATNWIAANGVTKDNIEFASGLDIPWMGNVVNFASWLRGRPNVKRFCEWNGGIHFTAEFIQGKSPIQGVATTADLEGV